MQHLGFQVVPVDLNAAVSSSSRLARELVYRFASGPVVTRMNELVLQALREFGRRIDTVWIDKGLWMQPDTLQRLKQATGAVLVHYTADPQVVFQRQKLGHFLPSIPLYDILFTTKPFEVDAYKRHGARNVQLVHQSYDEECLQPRQLSNADRRRLGSEVCFIGQYTAHYARLLKAAGGTGAEIRLWGPNWRRRLWRHRWAEPIFAGDGLWGEDYAIALNAADIGLCFLSKRYPETTTTRSFEIPGCGTFMLAERTEEHLELFAEGVEAEYFGSAAELVDKIRFYLRNPGPRNKIAQAGHLRCTRSGHGNHARMKSLLKSTESCRDVRTERGLVSESPVRLYQY